MLSIWLTRIIRRPFSMRGLEFNLSENWKRKKDHAWQIRFSLFFSSRWMSWYNFFYSSWKQRKLDGVRYFFSLWNATFPLLLSNYSRTRTFNLKNSPQVPNPNPTRPQNMFSAIEIIFLGRFFKVLFWKLRNIWSKKCPVFWEFFESGFGISSQSEKYLSRYYEKKSLPNRLSVGLLWPKNSSSRWDHSLQEDMSEKKKYPPISLRVHSQLANSFEGKHKWWCSSNIVLRFPSSFIQRDTSKLFTHFSRFPTIQKRASLHALNSWMDLEKSEWEPESLNELWFLLKLIDNHSRENFQLRDKIDFESFECSKAG